MIGQERGRTIYFIGIGGIVMAQAALLLQELGYHVRGADTTLYPPADQLLKEGEVPIEEGYDATHLFPHPDLVVIGNSVSRGNPEVEVVLDEGIPYLSLPELIRKVFLQRRRSVVVTGTHGKTTTASLLAWLLFRGGLDPSFIIGGVPLNFGRGFRYGEGDWVVLEGDEYDSAFFDKRPKFLHYLPRMVILNNIEYDHADIYRDLEEIKLSFCHLLRMIPNKGVVIGCADDKVTMEIISQVSCQTETFGTKGKWSLKDVIISPKGTSFCLLEGKENLGTFDVTLWGEHNLKNTLAAVVTAHLLGISIPKIREGLRTFQGVKRRMEVVGEVRGIMVIDDFAHHPTAVRETLRAVRSRFNSGRLWAIFEPRTQTIRRGFLQRELALALGEAEKVVIGKVLPTADGKGLDPQLLLQEIKGVKGTHALYVENLQEIVTLCVEGVEPGDVVLVMSSGYFDGLPRRIFDALTKIS
jgi:UDP-N-acetylmuramate: L-alanyl-gamma-D-glutamyl-meso-diaminopimelate ligase